MSVKFVAVQGSSFSDEDAARLGPELSRIAATHANPTNDTVVEAARDPNSPLHDFIYKYDDTEAARRHRVDIARHIVRSILVEFERGGKTHTKRAFEYIEVVFEEPVAAADGEPQVEVAPTVRPSAQASFGNRTPRRIVTAAYVMEHPDAEAQVIANAELQLAAFQQKYDGYVAMHPNFAARFRKVFAEIQALFAERPARPRRRKKARRR